MSSEKPDSAPPASNEAPTELSNTDTRPISVGNTPENSALKKANKEFDILARITTPVIIKYIKFLNAENVILRGLRVTEFENKAQPDKKLIDVHHAQAALNDMRLVYVVSIFDAFIADLNKFYMLTRRDTLSEEFTVPIAKLMNPAATAEAITSRIDKRNRDSGAQSLIERVTSLYKKLSPASKIDEKTRRAVVDLSKARNILVHSHDVFSLSLDDELSIKAISVPERATSDEQVLESVSLFATLIIDFFKKAAAPYQQHVGADVIESVCGPLAAMARPHTEWRKESDAP